MFLKSSCYLSWPTFGFPSPGWVNLQVGAFHRSGEEEERMWSILICQVAKRKFVSLYLTLAKHYLLLKIKSS